MKLTRWRVGRLNACPTSDAQWWGVHQRPRLIAADGRRWTLITQFGLPLRGIGKFLQLRKLSDMDALGLQLWGRQFCLPLSFSAIVLSASIGVHQRPRLIAADGRRCTLITQFGLPFRFLQSDRFKCWSGFSNKGKVSGIPGSWYDS